MCAREYVAFSIIPSYLFLFAAGDMTPGDRGSGHKPRVNDFSLV